MSSDESDEVATFAQRRADSGGVDHPPVQRVFEELLAIRSRHKPERPFYCVWGEVPICDLPNLLSPGLVVDNDEVGLPLSECCLNRLRTKTGAFEQAPFGKGNETVLDLTVRKTLQVAASRISFRNPRFLSDLHEFAVRTLASLGVNEPIIAHLHKLLVYSPGDFFKPHRDAVHSPNQFATLVLQLPSVYTGGVLRVVLGDSASEIDLSGAQSRYMTQYATFFSDCLHEILPVESGYRTCLTFDICHANPGPQEDSEVEPGQTIAAQGGKKIVDTTRLRDALQLWKHQVHTAETEVAATHRLCHCGQVALPSSIRKKGDAGGNTDNHEFRWSFRDEGTASSSNCLLLVLDHMLPANVLSSIDSTNLCHYLWAFRGADRVRLQALLGVQGVKDDFEIYSGRCEFKEELLSSGDNTTTTYTFYHSALCKPEKSLVLCRCMIRSTSRATLRNFRYDREYRGNEEEFIDNRYEFHGIFMFPKLRKNEVLCSLIKFDKGNFETLCMETEEKALSLESMDGYSGRPLESNISHDILRSFPVELLLSDRILGDVHADPISPNVRLAALKLFHGYYKTDSDAKKQTRSFDWLVAHKHLKTSSLDCDRAVYNRLKAVLLRTSELKIEIDRQESDNVDTAAMLAVDVLMSEHDLSLVKTFLQRCKHDKGFLLYKVLMAMFSDVEKLDSAIKPLSEEEVKDFLSNIIKPELVKDFERYTEHLVEPRLSREIRFTDLSSFTFIIAAIIESWSQPGHPLYSFAVDIASTLMSSNIALNMAVVIHWMCRNDDELNGTIVMQPVVESLISSLEARAKKIVDEVQALRKQPPPPGCPDTLLAFLTDETREPLVYTGSSDITTYLSRSFEGRDTYSIFRERYGICRNLRRTTADAEWELVHTPSYTAAKAEAILLDERPNVKSAELEIKTEYPNPRFHRLTIGNMLKGLKRLTYTWV